MSLFEGLFTPRWHISVDDGGVRCLSGSLGRYIPLTTLEDATLEYTAFFVPLLRLAMRDGSRITLRMARDEALEAHGEVVRHVAALPAMATRLADTTLAALGRGVVPLLDWLASVMRWAQSGEGYRTAALDHEAAKATLLDAAAPAELRAACAHAMLATGHEDELAAVTGAFIERALPPLVVIAARLGRGGAALVPDGMWEDALGVLPVADAEDARRAISSPVTHENEAHVHEVMVRVKPAALLEASKLPPPPHKKHLAPRLAHYDFTGRGSPRTWK